jgi:hypothetical protein
MMYTTVMARLHDILVKFHEIGTGVQALLRFCLRNLKLRNYGIIDGRGFYDVCR